MFPTLCFLALWAAAPAADSARFDSLFDEGLQALNQERYDVAVPRLREAVREARKFGNADARLLDAAVHLALACGEATDQICSAAQWETDLQLARKLAETAKGPDRELARILMELGDADYAASNYPAAAGAYRRAQTLRVKALGPTHPDVARTYTALAWVSFQQKDQPKARREFVHALGLREQAGAGNTAPFAELVEEYGRLLEQMEDFPAADAQYERATALRERLWKESDPRFITGLNDIAQACRFRKEPACAEQRYQRVVKIQQESRGDQSAEHLEALRMLGDFYTDQEKWGLAALISGQCAAVAQGSGRLGAAADCQRQLGLAQAGLGRFQLAAQAGEAELAARAALQEQDRELRNHLLARLAPWCLQAGDPNRAETHFEALRSQTDTLDLSIVTAEQMGEIYSRQAKYKAAVAKFELAAAACEARYGADSKDLPTKLNRLAQAYQAAGQPFEAQQTMNRAARLELKGLFQGDEGKAVAIGMAFIVALLLIGGGVVSLVFWLLTRRLDRQISALFAPPPWWGYAVPVSAPAPSDPPEPAGEAPPQDPVPPDEPAPCWDPTDTVPLPERPSGEPEPAFTGAGSGGPETVAVAVAEAPPPAAQWQPLPLPPAARLSFHGEGFALFAIRIANILLGLVTLGVYYFWGKAKIRRYLYAQTEFDGDRLQFHGTGLELLLGWLKGAPVLALLVLTPYALPMLWTSQWSLVVAQYAVAAGFWLVWPLARAGAYRYRVNRMSWRGIRFSFRGSTWEFWKLCLKSYGLILTSAGFYYPYYQVKTQAYLTNHTWFGDEPFHYEGDGLDLLPNWAAAGPMFYLTLGLGWVWWSALQQRYHWSRTTFAGARLRCTATGWRLLWLWAVNIAVTILTVGLGTPWVITRTARFWTRHVEIVGWLDLSRVRQDARVTSAVGEGFADFLGFDFGF